jgi:hypothetical protein
MKNLLYLMILSFIFLFSFFIFFNYSSSSNAVNIKESRKNLDNKLSSESTNLPLLKNDTNNVVNFNSGYNNIDLENSQRNFWDLFKKQ